MKSLSFFKVLPTFSVLILIMGGCSLQIGEYPLLPSLYLIPIYYWIIFSPSWLPLWSLFGIGLFYDSLMGHELGISSLLLMLSGVLGVYVRPLLISHYFPLIWGVFVLYSLGFLLLAGLFLGFEFPFCMSWFYGVMLYPLVALILSHLHLYLQAYV